MFTTVMINMMPYFNITDRMIENKKRKQGRASGQEKGRAAPLTKKKQKKKHIY